MDVLRQIFGLQINMRYQITGFNGCLVSGHKILSFYIFRIVWNLKWPPIVVQKVWLFRLCVIYNCNISIYRHDKKKFWKHPQQAERMTTVMANFCVFIFDINIFISDIVKSKPGFCSFWNSDTRATNVKCKISAF